MGTSEEEFMIKLTETFHTEAEEHLKALNDGLLVLEKGLPEEQSTPLINSIFREAHSLKGAARAVNQRTIQEICQALEDVLAVWTEGKLQPSTSLFDSLHATVDAIRKALSSNPIIGEIQPLIVRLEAFAKESNANPGKTLEAVAPQIEQMMQREAPEAKPEGGRDKTIRVSVSKLDRVFQETEEMLMIKLASQQQSNQIKNLLTDLRDKERELIRIHRKCDTIEQARQALSQERQTIKTCIEAVAALSKDSQRNAHMVGSLVDTLLEDIKTVLMQPISTLFDSFPRMVRDIARDLRKEVQFESQGREIEVDRRILEEMKDAIIHLIRNAIDHGIETPEKRAEQGKPRMGTIKILATESGGGNVEIVISDDGRGFDIEKLKSAALKRSRISSKEAAEMSREEALQLAFFTGVSTSPIITDLSGRGVGLSIVTEKTDKLGGRVYVESEEGKGTAFRFVLPLTLATFRGLHVTVASQDFIVPTHNVKRVLRIKRDEIKTIENYETISVDSHPHAFVDLATLLKITRRKVPQSPMLFALIIKSEDKTIAFGVDAVHREYEVLVKELGKQCVRVKNVMAATIMEWGNVIPILNPVDLVRSAVKESLPQKTSTQAQEGKARKKVVLIVEDSITTRLLLKNIMESAGYEVKTASDGLEGLEILQAQKVDLLLTDVEMPRMDGFSLTEQVRSMEALKDLPIIICTTRGSNEDRERGIELGANAYLDKSNFTQPGLLSVAQKLL